MNQKIILFSILIMLIMSILPMNSVSAVLDDLTLADWDDIASGLDSGTSGYIDFESTGDANYFETSTVEDLTAPNSFRIEAEDTGVPYYQGSGYWNLTDSYEYIGVINFSFVFKTGNGLDQVDMEFYNDTNKVIDLRFHDNNGAAEGLYWWDVSAGEQTVISGIGSITNARLYLIIEHNGTNQFHIELLDSAFAVVAEKDFAGAYASNWETFTHIQFGSSTSNNAYARLYIDNVLINLDEGVGVGSDTEISDYTRYVNQYCGVSFSMNVFSWAEFQGNVKDFPTTNFILYPEPTNLEMKRNEKESGTIHYVDLYVTSMQIQAISGNLNDYTCYVNGESFGHPIAFVEKSIGITTGYLIRFYSVSGKLLENEYPLFSFSCSKYYDFGSSYGNSNWYPFTYSGQCGWDARKHESTANLIDDELDGVPMNNQLFGSTDWPFGISHRVSPYVEYYYIPLSGYLDADDNIEEVNETIMLDYRDAYGDPTKDDCFIEFWEGNQQCRYRVGSQPEIIFYINDTWLNYGSVYRFQIRHIDNEGDKVVDTGLITMHNAHEQGKFKSTYKFEDDGYYYIVLYNVSDANKTIHGVVLESSYITVCKDDTIIPDPYADDTGFSLPVLIRSILDPTTRVLVGLIILGGITFSPFIASMKLKQKNVTINIPNILYGVMFGVGVVANYILGFFGLIELFFLLAILITIVLFIYYTGKTKATGDA